MCRRKLVVEERRLIVAAEKEVAVEAREVAIDLLGAPFERLRNAESIAQSFRYFLTRHRSRILAALQHP